MPLEPSETYVRKLRTAEDLAARLQKAEWQSRGNREKLEGIVKESLDFVRSHDLTARYRRLAALEKANQQLDGMRQLGERDTNQRLDVIFYQLRTARTGR